MKRYGNAKQRTKHGKTFKATKGKHKGKLVKYAYTNGKKSTRKMVLHKGRRY